MKNTLKYFMVMLLVVALVFPAAGCGREDDAAGSGAGTEERKDYVSEYVNLGGGMDDMAFYY